MERVRSRGNDLSTPLPDDAVPPPTHLLSALSRLSLYVTSLGEQEEALLLAVAPHVGVEYNADDFFKDLDRLADDSPGVVCRVLDKVLKGYKPDYDFEGRLRKLLRKLALRQETGNDTLRLAERLVSQLPGMVEFYKETSLGSERSLAATALSGCRAS